MARKAGEKMVERPGDKTTEKMAEKAGDKTVEKTVEKTAERAGDKTAEKTVEKTTEKTGDKTLRKTGGKDRGTAAEDVTDEASKTQADSLACSEPFSVPETESSASGGDSAAATPSHRRRRPHRNVLRSPEVDAFIRSERRALGAQTARRTTGAAPNC